MTHFEDGINIRQALSDLFISNPNIKIKDMGFPEDWKNHLIWKS